MDLAIKEKLNKIRVNRVLELKRSMKQPVHHRKTNHIIANTLLGLPDIESLTLNTLLVIGDLLYFNGYYDEEPYFGRIVNIENKLVGKNHIDDKIKIKKFNVFGDSGYEDVERYIISIYKRINNNMFLEEFIKNIRLK